MRRPLFILGISAALVAAGCGDDDDGGGDGDLQAYCALVAEFDQQESVPSEEQLEEVRDVAPEEISDEIGTVVDAFLANQDDPEAVFDDPDVSAAFEEIAEFEQENCPGRGSDGAGDGDEGHDDGDDHSDGSEETTTTAGSEETTTTTAADSASTTTTTG